MDAANGKVIKLLANLTSWNLILTTLLVGTLYISTLVLYRLYFCPVAAIPGPFLAKITYWYEFYYDCILIGQYTFQLPALHAKYGPIIRINPHEVHIADADFYDTVYAGPAHKRERWKWYINGFSAVSESLFATIDHEKHRAKRSVLNPYFSKAKARSLQPIIEERARALSAGIMSHRCTGVVIKAKVAFAAVVNDIVMQYAFGRSDSRADAVDFKPDYHDAVMSVMSVAHLSKHFPWMYNMMACLPDKIAAILSPGMFTFIRLDREMTEQVKMIHDRPADLKFNVMGQPTIFHEILNSSLPPEEKTITRLTHNGQALVAAGTLTTADALSVSLFYLLSRPATLRKLKEELICSFPSHDVEFPSLVALEQLPYLTVIIKEVLRLSNGGSTRLARLSPIEPVLFRAKAKDGGREYLLPPGTPMSMTSMLIHFDGELYQDPMEFIPERWFGNPKLDKYFHPFNAGTRICLGMNLALAELYIVLAMIFLNFGSSYAGEEVRFEGDQGLLELYDTTQKDIDIWGDVLVPLPAPGTNGVRFVVKE